ncbi:MAG: hypothetical protein KF859_10025 [Phycisphaeraceae bacterium]|nr:hypothetical protein [Phycisphaeraceae bacterium]
MPRCARAACLLALLGAAWGCAREERVISQNSFLTGLPGAQQGLPVSRAGLVGHVDPTLVVNEQNLVQEEKETGRTLLLAKSGRHLMIHLYTTVDEGNRELFIDQVMSASAKAAYFRAGRDPGEVFDELREYQHDLQKLFKLMPAGERTPGMFMVPAGGGIQRVELNGIARRGQRWTGFEMVMERGNWRLWRMLHNDSPI